MQAGEGGRVGGEGKGYRGVTVRVEHRPAGVLRLFLVVVSRMGQPSRKMCSGLICPEGASRREGRRREGASGTLIRAGHVLVV